VEIEVDLSCRLMVIDCHFCNTLPNLSESIFADSLTA
jgi:hypothetical protein